MCFTLWLEMEFGVFASVTEPHIFVEPNNWHIIGSLESTSIYGLRVYDFDIFHLQMMYRNDTTKHRTETEITKPND